MKQRLRTSAIAPVLFGVSLAFLGACSPVQRAQGSRGIVASFQRPTLSAQLPPEVRVPAVIAAADQVCRERGYSIVSNQSTEEAGRIVARPPRTGDFPTIAIAASIHGEGTRIEVEVQPFGDQDWSRSVLDGILQKLGL